MIAIAHGSAPPESYIATKTNTKTYHNTTGAGLNNVCKNLDNDSIYHVP